MPQLKIAAKCGAHQTTVSRRAAEFKKEVAVKGIDKAAGEYGVMEIVAELRSVALELHKNKATVEDAMSGLTMVKLFNTLGVPPEEYKTLAKAVSKVKEPDYIKAAMALAKLEESTGKDYADLISEFEQLSMEIAAGQEAIATIKEKQEKAKKSFEELELTLNKKEEELAEFLKESEQKKAAADTGLKEKLAEAGLTIEKIAKVHPVVEKINALGISDDKLEIFVEEHRSLEEQGVTWEKFQAVAGALAKAGEIDGDGLAIKMTEYGTLDQVIASLKADKTSLQPEVQELGKKKAELTAEVDGLGKSQTHLEIEVEHLKGLKKALDDTINTLDVRRNHLEKHLTTLENDVAKLTADKAALIEEADQKHLAVSEMQEKLKESEAVDRALKEKNVTLQELDSKISAAGQNFQLYEGFLGLVGKRGEAEIENFLKSVPMLINEAKTGKYNPGLLVDVILNTLSGNTLEHLICQTCKAEFIMLNRGQKAMAVAHLPGDIPKWCPDCSAFGTMEAKAPLAETLKKVIFSKKIITVKGPEKTDPDEKYQPKNQGG